MSLQAIVQFATGVVLARLLPPEDFGLAALALVVVGFVQMLAEMGLSSAVVHQRPLTERHVRVAFTLSVTLATVLTVALFGLAPYAATVFRHPLLPAVLRAESPLFILMMVGMTARALLRRALDFRRLFLIEAGSFVGGYVLVAVTLALLGFGVWSLVLGVLAQWSLAAALSLALAPHRVRPLLAVQEGRQLLGYGLAATLNAVVSHAARSADSIVIGRWLGASALGLYTRALHVITIPLSFLGNALAGVLFPAMSEIRGDARRFRTAYFLGIQVTTMLAAPLCAGLVVAAPHLIVSLYGEEWRGAILPLQVIATAGLFRAVYHVAGAVTFASGKVMAEARRQMGFTVLVVVGGVIGASWGIGGVAVGVAVGMFFMYLTMAQLSLRIVGGAWRDFLTAHLPGVALGLEVGTIAFAVRWTLERGEVGSPGILMAIIVACTATLPLGVYFLPARLRPTDLFTRFDAPISRLPASVRVTLSRVLRLAD
jgi:PST family polysaccharide transporter